MLIYDWDRDEISTWEYGACLVIYLLIIENSLLYLVHPHWLMQWNTSFKFLYGSMQELAQLLLHPDGGGISASKIQLHFKSKHCCNTGNGTSCFSIRQSFEHEREQSLMMLYPSGTILLYFTSSILDLWWVIWISSVLVDLFESILTTTSSFLSDFSTCGGTNSEILKSTLPTLICSSMISCDGTSISMTWGSSTSIYKSTVLEEWSVFESWIMVISCDGTSCLWMSTVSVSMISKSITSGSS